jgi:uncharacterized membrane protein YtjA (UPF0391 family)
MLNYAIIFFVLAVITGVLGFGGMAGTFAWAAKTLFIGFIILTVVLFLFGRKPSV